MNMNFKAFAVHFHAEFIDQSVNEHSRIDLS